MTKCKCKYVNYCVDLCIPIKKIKYYNNNKPWFNKDIKQLRKEKNAAHLSGNKEQYMASKYKLRSAIRRAKSNYATKLEEQITTNDTRFIWKKLQNMTNYKKKPTPIPDGDDQLSDTLNFFYGRFEQVSATPPPSPPDPLPSPPPLLLFTRRR